MVREYLWQSCYCIEWQFQKKKKSAVANKLKMTKQKEFIAEGWHILRLHKAAVGSSRPLPGRKSPEMTRKKPTVSAHRPTLAAALQSLPNWTCGKGSGWKCLPWIHSLSSHGTVEISQRYLKCFGFTWKPDFYFFFFNL